MEPPRRVATPWAQKVADLRRGPLSLLVWGLAVLAVALLLQRRAREPEHLGLALALEHVVAPVAGGTLQRLQVDLFDDVAAGDPVALLDATEVEARLATSAAAVDRLAAELDAERVRLAGERSAGRDDRLDDLRRFRADEERLHLDVLALEVRLESDRVELDRVTLQVSYAEALVEQAIGPESELEDQRLLRRRIERGIEANERLLAETRQAYAAATRRKQEIEADLAVAPDADALLEPFARAIRVEELRLREVEIQRAALVLRAPASGRVARVLARPGATLGPGEPVVLITSLHAGEILAWLSPSPELDGSVREGARVEIVRPAEPGVVRESLIRRVGPAVDELPERLWRTPGVPEYGLPVLIAAVDEPLLPGETVRVRLPR